MSILVKRNEHVIPDDVCSLISLRYKTLTKAVNREFWDLTSEIAHSLYVGSYGRRTAIETSDIDILVELPKIEFERFDNLKGNGQSRLLQVVKFAIQKSYPRTDIRADGQVVKILFSDDMKFEVLPAFRITNLYGTTYQYPDSNMGGNWLSTNPTAEQKAMQDKNKLSSGLLDDTCKHIRYIHDDYFSSYFLSGIVIDSFVYEAIGCWAWTNDVNSSSLEGDYEKHLYNYCVQNYKYRNTIIAPGSNQSVNLERSYDCLEKVLCKIAH